MTSRTLGRQQQEKCPIFKIDRQGRFVYLDELTEKLLGLPSEELFVKSIEEFLEPESFEALRSVMTSGSKCETFYYPMQLNIIDSENKTRPCSAVVSLNFVAGNPANYQVILTPQKENLERSEVYSADSKNKNLLYLISNILADTDREPDFQKIAEVIIEQDEILCAGIYSIDGKNDICLAYATRRPFSHDENNLFYLFEKNRSNLLSGHKYSDQVKAPKDNNFSDNENLIESGFPLKRQDKVVGALLLIHSPFDDDSLQDMINITRVLSHLIPNTDKEIVQSANTNSGSVDDLAIEYILKSIKPLGDSISENLDDFSDKIGNELNADSKDKFIYIRKSSEVLSKFIEKLQNCYVCPKSENSDYKKVDLNRVLRDVYQQLSLNYPKINVFLKNISLPIIVTDETKIKIVFDCILANAFRYANPENTLEIEVVSRSDDKQMIISIKDNGCGIPQDNADEIFRPFRIVKEPRHNILQGPGLGLALARAMVRSINGDVLLDLSNQDGTKINIVLPHKDQS